MHSVPTFEQNSHQSQAIVIKLNNDLCSGQKSNGMREH